jgi:ribosome-binding protein aMBF1 (putative translation factor)
VVRFATHNHPSIVFSNHPMAKKSVNRVFRKERVSAKEGKRLNEVRRKVMKEFPPDPARRMPARSGLAAEIRAAREAQGLSWYTVAKLAKIENAGVIRDIEYGREVKLSSVEAVAAALGLKLELTGAAH